MFKLTINTVNAAFTDNFEGELARILRRVAERVKQGEEYGAAVDLNGNTVGDFDIGDKPETEEESEED